MGVGELGVGEGIKQKKKKERELIDVDNIEVTAEGGGMGHRGDKW